MGIRPELIFNSKIISISNYDGRETDIKRRVANLEGQYMMKIHLVQALFFSIFFYCSES